MMDGKFTKPFLSFLIGIALVSGVVCWLYGSSLNIGFLGDDFNFLDAGRSFSNAGEAFIGDWISHRENVKGARYYRPLQIVLLAVEFSIWGENPWGYHLDTLLIHIGCSLLTAVLIRRLGRQAGYGGRPLETVAWVGALLFAVHPRHTEAVCMINGRTDSFCALFYLGSLIAYLKWKQEGKTRDWWFSGFWFCGALLAKEMAVSLPLVLLVYEFALFLKNPPGEGMAGLRAALRTTVPFFLILVVIFGGVRTWALGGYVFGKGSYALPHTALPIYFISLCKMLVAMLLPFDPIIRLTALHYPRHPFAYGVPLALLLIGLFWAGVRKGSIVGSLGLFLWFGCAFPTLAMMSEAVTTLSDRYLYIPSIGFPLVVAACLLRLMSCRRILSWVGWVFVVLWLLFAARQTAHYAREWSIAGESAATLVRQIQELDRQRPPDERFLLLSLPGLYQGKTILNTALSQYWYNKTGKERSVPRVIVPFLFLVCDAPPSETKTTAQWDNKILQYPVEGGYFLSTYATRFENIELILPTFYPGAQKVEFLLRQNLRKSLLLVFHQGKLEILPPAGAAKPVGEFIAAQAVGKRVWMKRFRLPDLRAVDSGFPATPPDFMDADSNAPKPLVHVASGDVNGDGQADGVLSFGPPPPSDSYRGMVFVWNVTTEKLIGHPFTPFPPDRPSPARNPYGEVFTAVGKFVAGATQSQIACAQGLGGHQMVRLYQYTGQPSPNGYKIIGQFSAFDPPFPYQEEDGGVALAAGDLNGDGVDELIVAQANNRISLPHIQVIEFGKPMENGAVPVRRRSRISPVFQDPRCQGIRGISPAVGDVDGDGLPEIVVASRVTKVEKESEKVSSYLSLLRPQIVRGHVEDCRAIPNGILELFSPARNPAGAVSVGCGNLDQDSADEIVVGTGAYASRIADNPNQTLQMRYAGQFSIAAFDLTFKEDGAIDHFAPISAFPSGNFLPFRIAENNPSGAVDFAIADE